MMETSLLEWIVIVIVSLVLWIFIERFLPHFFAVVFPSCRCEKYIKKEKIIHWKQKDGTLVKYSYVGSRQFYCTFYERLSSGLPDLEHLKTLIQDGWNLQITGYDALDDLTAENVEKYYLDQKRPFGHESVLFTILVLPEAKWPWRKSPTKSRPSRSCWSYMRSRVPWSPSTPWVARRK